MNETNPKVAFVVVGWNNKNLLRECFDSILQQTYKNVMIVYVDNNSSDSSVEWVASKYPEVIVAAQDKNTGFAKGNNHGIAVALQDPDVEYVGLLNTDARIDPDWTASVIKFAEMKPRGACFQGTTVDYFKPRVIDSTHIFVARNGQGTQGNWRYYDINELGPKKVFGVNAAACMISRRFIEAQPFGKELFDETMFMYLEDVDLAARATIMGWDNYLVSNAVAYHMGSVSSKNKSASFSLYMTFRNNTGMLFKNFPARMLLKMTKDIIKMDINTWRALWHQDRKDEIWPVIKGRLVGIIRTPLFIRKRHKLARFRHIDPDYLWQLMKEGY